MLNPTENFHPTKTAGAFAAARCIDFDAKSARGLEHAGPWRTIDGLVLGHDGYFGHARIFTSPHGHKGKNAVSKMRERAERSRALALVRTNEDRADSRSISILKP